MKRYSVLQVIDEVQALADLTADLADVVTAIMRERADPIPHAAQRVDNVCWDAKAISRRLEKIALELDE